MSGASSPVKGASGQEKTFQKQASEVTLSQRPAACNIFLCYPVGMKGSSKHFTEIVYTFKNKGPAKGKRYVIREYPAASGEMGTPHLFDPSAPLTKLVAEKPPPAARTKKKKVIIDNRATQPDFFEPYTPKKK